MQVLDERKRRRIFRVASALFAGQAYDKVRLEEIARRADVGKGTLYTYFTGKDSLYEAVMYDSFDRLLAELRRLTAADHHPRRTLRRMVMAIMGFAAEHPQLFNLTRTPPAVMGAEPWAQRRREMFALLAKILRAGVQRGLWRDARPEWTALYLAGMIRAMYLFQSPRPKRTALATHIIQMVTGSMGSPRDAAGRVRPE